MSFAINLQNTKIIYDKHRLEVNSRVKKFLKIANNWLDDVHKRISDCTDVHRLYGADLCHHST